jgi:CHAT domain-containing protein
LSRTFTISPVSLGQLQKVLPDKTTVVSFFVGRQRTTALTINRTAVSTFELDIGHGALSERVEHMRRNMRAFGAVDDEIAELSSALLPPLQDALADAEVLVFVPHGPLHHVPFAALPVDGEPLLDRVVVAAAPSGSMLYDQLRLPPRARPRNVVVLAPADDLPFARLEALAIGGERALLGEAATETALRDLRADAVDVAAHGELDARDPLSSGIVMRRGAADDGRLELHEVFALPHIPALVTLSACDSSSFETHGNEWLGLGGAFLTSGARTVIASVNRVSDLAASVVMKRFYRSVRDQPAGEALRAAALSARRYFPHPAHWSSFVLMGDFR